MSEGNFDQGMSGLEAELASLRWRTSGIDRDRMLYLAGRASAASPRAPISRPRRWLWPMTTAASTLVAVVLGCMLASDGKSPSIEALAGTTVEPPNAAGEGDPSPSPSLLPRHTQRVGTAPQAEYLALRDLVLTQGIDAWHVAQEGGAFEDDTLTSGDAYQASFN